jgi:hypothetical protein
MGEKWANGAKLPTPQPRTCRPRSGAQIPDELTSAACVANTEGGVQQPGDVYGPLYADSVLVAWAWMDSAHINFLTTIKVIKLLRWGLRG